MNHLPPLIPPLQAYYYPQVEAGKLSKSASVFDCLTKANMINSREVGYRK